MEVIDKRGICSTHPISEIEGGMIVLQDGDYFLVMDDIDITTETFDVVNVRNGIWRQMNCMEGFAICDAELVILK